MRMWNVDPRILCRNHLLGEHLEVHMFVGTLNKGCSVQGYLSNGLLEIHSLDKRHNELVAEMLRRGYNHNSPLPSYVVSEVGKINTKQNLKELMERCENCRKNVKNMNNRGSRFGEV